MTITFECTCIFIASVKKSNNQFGELTFHGGFQLGRESLGKLVLLLLLYNVLTCYNIHVCGVPAKKCFGNYLVRSRVFG